MPEVECPIAGCTYKTADLDNTVVIALINAHCANHVYVLPALKSNSKSHIKVSNPTAATNLEKNTNLSLKMITLQDLRLNTEIRGNFIGFIFCILSLLVDIAFSFSQSYWYYSVDVNDRYNSTSSVGLWKACIVKTFKGIQSPIEWSCVSHNQYGLNEYTILGGAQFFQCLGLIFTTVAILCTFLKLFLWREPIILSVLGAIHAFWSGISFLGSTGFVSNGLRKMPQPYYTDFGHTCAGVSGAIALVGSFTLVATACWTHTQRKQRKKEKSGPAASTEEHTYQELTL